MSGEGGHTLEVELGNGALDGEGFTELHVVEVLGHFALVILFDEEGELAGLVGGGDGGVGTNDGLALGVKEGVGAIRGGLDDDT